MDKVMISVNGMDIDFVRAMQSKKAAELLKNLKSMGQADEVDRCFAEADDPLLSKIRREWLVMTKRSAKQSSQEKAVGSMDHVCVTEYGELLGIDKSGMLFAAFIPNDNVELWDHQETEDTPGFTKDRIIAFYEKMLESEWDEGKEADKKMIRLNVISSDAYTMKMRGMLLKRSLIKDSLKYLADRITVRYDGKDMIMMQSAVPTGVCYVFMRRYTF